MRVSDVQQVIASLINEISKSDTVQLTPGQIVSVFLKEIQGDMALVNFQGKDILAKLEAEVPVGQPLKCLVEGERDGKIVLKLLTGNRDSGGQAITNILSSLGLDGGQFNMRLVSEMIKQEMPLTPESTKMLSAFLRSINVSDGDVWIPVFMYKQGIPLTQQNFQGISEMLTNMKYLQPELGKLSGELQKIMAAVQPGDELGELATSINRAIANFQMTSSEGAGSLASKLQAVFRMLNLQPQTFPANALQAEGTQAGTLQTGVTQAGTLQAGAALGGAAPAGSPTAGSLTAGSLTAGLLLTGTAQNDTMSTGQPGNIITETKVPPVVQAILGKLVADISVIPGNIEGTSNIVNNSSEKLAGIELQSNKADAQQILNDIINRLAGLIDKTQGQTGKSEVVNRLFSSLHSLVETTGVDDHAKPDLTTLLGKLAASLNEKGGSDFRDLVKLTQNVAEKLEFIQNFNRNPETGRDKMMFIYSTVKFEDREEPLRLVVNYRKEGKFNNRDFSSCKVEVKLNTPNLGLVKCEIQVNDKNLTLQFVTTNEPAGKVIDRGKDTLAICLEEMKYHVKLLPCQIQPETVNSLPLAENQDIPGLFQINFRV